MKKIIALLYLWLNCLTALAQQEGLIESSGSKLYYRIYGSGMPVLIINGGPGMNSDGFAELAMELSASNKTIIYDQRGTGKSMVQNPDSTTITMDLMVQDMENLRKHLHISKWILLGHSFGGMLAAYYATVYPQNIHAIILSSSGGINLGLLNYVGNAINTKLTAGEQQAVQYWTKKISEGDTTHNARLQRGMALAPAYLYNRKNIPVIAERLTQGNATINALVWQNLTTIKFNCAPKLSAAVFPVLIVQGKQDIVTEETAFQSHKAFKNSTVVFIDHCVHYGWLDNTEKYFEVINNFLAKMN